MLLFRGALACGMVVAGIAIVARMIGFGASAPGSIVPGLVLGAAMIALGVYRLRQIRGVRRPR